MNERYLACAHYSPCVIVRRWGYDWKGQASQLVVIFKKFIHVLQLFPDVSIQFWILVNPGWLNLQRKRVDIYAIIQLQIVYDCNIFSCQFSKQNIMMHYFITMAISLTKCIWNGAIATSFGSSGLDAVPLPGDL